MSKYTIPNIANTCTIFQLLSECSKPLSVSEISRRLDLPKTSVYRILKTLEQENMVRSAGKGYVMGHRLINLGMQLVSRIPERRLSVPILQSLTNKTQESSHFAILSGLNMLLVEVCDTAAPTNIASRPGTLADIHCSASGKCLLAFAPPMSAERILNSIEYTPRTPMTLASKSSLLRDLESVRSNGFAVDEQEYHESRRCIAAPVFNGSSAGGNTQSPPVLS